MSDHEQGAIIPYVTIKEYVDRILHERAKSLDERMKSIDDRLETMNEVREQLTQQNASFSGRIGEYLPRAEYDARHEALRAEVRRIEMLTQTKVPSEEIAKMEIRVRQFERWQSNVNGRLWAIAGALAMIQFLFTFLRLKTGS